MPQVISTFSNLCLDHIHIAARFQDAAFKSFIAEPKMLSTKYIPALWALVAMYLPEASWAAPTSETTTKTSFAVGGPEATPEASVPADGNFVVTVVNSHTAAISTSHFQGAGSPTAIRHDNEQNIVAPDETFSFAVPTGVSQVFGPSISPLSW